jgi:tripeptidyl-peptidase-1
VAGIISLLNDPLVSDDEAPLGFLNPWLYVLASAGLNVIEPRLQHQWIHCILSKLSLHFRGWLTEVLWVTGQGTPDFGKLEEILDEMIRADRVGLPQATRL